MFTSNNQKTALTTAAVYTVVTVITALFGAVYECFGHGVYSYFMLYAFAFPLLFGTMIFLILALTDSPVPEKLTRHIYHSAVATATVGSIFQGVLDIYGTSSALSYVYVIGGVVLFVIAVTRYILELLQKGS